ncbi:MAG TPA: MarR family transcriptional regulator [Candidatus Limnocylindrales bacterium]|nr:MarR family transcriptional regulator [Candidatus Limnocylindrales bacterium]
MSRSRLSDLELGAWQALLHTHEKITKQLDAELRDAHDIGLSDYDVLVRLANAPDRRLTMSELARRAMLPPSSLTRVIDRLVERGLIARDRSASDSRVVHASLTNAGRARVRSAARTHLRGIREQFTSQLTDEQLGQVTTALQVITGPHEPH